MESRGIKRFMGNFEGVVIIHVLNDFRQTLLPLPSLLLLLVRLLTLLLLVLLLVLLLLLILLLVVLVSRG